ncbi:multicopper oxidase family protein [Myxococcota bacterium]|nr:multicopper oxidase family protein [Myxococcota bacterium]
MLARRLRHPASRTLSPWAAVLALTAACSDGGGATEGEGAAGAPTMDAGGGAAAAGGGAAGEGGAAGGAGGGAGEPAVVDAGPGDALPDAAAPVPEAAPPEVWGAPLLADENPAPGVFEATVVAGVHPVTLDDGTELEMWLYNGQFPGPRIDVRAGDRVLIHFRNELPQETTIHWHGLRIPDAMDGSPRIQRPVQPGESFDYDFVVPEAGTYWYHPHVKANEQLERGLYAPLIVRTVDEPTWDRARMFVLDDILLRGGDFAPFLADHMEEMHGRFGNALLTNGAFQLQQDTVAPGTVERWHLVNAANARTQRLRVRGAEFRVIATDGGPLPEPYTPDFLEISPGQRFELEVRADGTGPVALDSLVDTVNAAGDVVTEPFPLFEGVPGEGEAAAPADWRFVPPTRAPARRPERQVVLELDGVNTAHGLEWLINGEAHAHAPLFTFRKGEVVEMTLRNLAGPEHPFHLHGQFFEIYPDSDHWRAQPGLKDVVLLPGQATVRLRAYMDNPGDWMMHCHILEHAELGMMATFRVEE